MKINANVQFTDDIICDFVGVYLRESRLQVGYRFGNDQTIRNVFVNVSDLEANDQIALTRVLSRAISKAVKDNAKVDKSATDMVAVLWVDQNAE
jgi:hypothetical protein